MKKIAALVLVFILFSIVFIYAETPEKMVEGSFSYVNVPIIKILEQKNNYIVYYRAFGKKIGCVSIPREWFRQGQTDRKGWVKPLAKGVEPYISVFFKDGEFSRIFLNVPNNKLDSVWGVFQGTKIPPQIDPEAFAHGL